MEPLLKYAAVAGNVVFMLWVTFNAIDSGFKGTIYEIVSGIGLVFLLALNLFLIIKK